MITCQHARHLFDRYLDGELSPSLQAELHAHQLSCTDCQSELALLEACGDVVSLDRREPVVSGSFTDRVMLAYRAQAVPAPRRRWGRFLLLTGSPMAAAASIVFAVLLIAPSTRENKTTFVAGQMAAVPSAVSDSLITAKGRERTEEEFRALKQTPEMPASFVETLLGPCVEQTRNTLEGTRRGFEQLESLIRLGVSGTNEALAAGVRPAPTEPAARPVPESRSPIFGEPNLLDPFYPKPAPTTPESSNDSDVDETVEAL